MEACTVLVTPSCQRKKSHLDVVWNRTRRAELSPSARMGTSSGVEVLMLADSTHYITHPSQLPLQEMPRNVRRNTSNTSSALPAAAYHLPTASVWAPEMLDNGSIDEATEDQCFPPWLLRRGDFQPIQRNEEWYPVQPVREDSCPKPARLRRTDMTPMK